MEKNERIGIMGGMLMNARREGNTRIIMRVPVDMLTIDSRYQTAVRTERDMNYLVKNWDEHKLLPLTVVPHDEDGLFYIVDGYGRKTASQLVDKERYKELECMIILDAPKNPVSRLQFEAEQYAFQNRNVAMMKPLHTHGAGRILGDKGVLCLDSMQKKYGFSYARQQGQRMPGVLGSYDRWKRTAASYGKECMEYILNLCQDLRYNGQSNGYATPILIAFKDAWLLFPKHRSLTAGVIASRYRGVSPAVLISNGVAKYPMLDKSLAVSMYVEDGICADLGIEHSRELKNSKAVKKEVV